MNELLKLFDPKLPLEEASTIPNRWYTDARMAAAERDAVFARSWQCVGRIEQVRDAGSYFTQEIAGEPLLVVRGSDGILRGFFNVCRHRAAPILDDACGSVNKLRCRYHGWTYDLSGQLRGTPEFDGVCSFDKSTQGLVPIAVAEWGPFVWVNLHMQVEPLPAYLAPLPEWANARDAFAGLQWQSRVQYEVACNWKVYVDNYLDGGYHVNSVHPALAGVIDYREYRTELFARCSLQSSPLKPGEGAVGATRTGDAAYWWIYPNFMLNLYSGVMDTNWVLPLGPDRCAVIFDFYFQHGATDEFIQQSLDVANVVQVEDVQICEQVQRGLRSRSYTTGRFSVKREAGGYHFHRLLAASLSLAGSASDGF